MSLLPPKSFNKRTNETKPFIAESCYFHEWSALELFWVAMVNFVSQFIMFPRHIC